MKKLSAYQWIWISLIGFALFVGFFYFIIVYSLHGRISTPLYFILIVFVALVATGFLSGAMNSAAKYSGTFQNRTLAISGPAVIFFIILYIGYKYKPEVQVNNPLSLSILFSDSEKKLLKEGAVSIRIGEYSSAKQINAEGQAVFTGINPAYKGSAIDFAVDIPGYLPDTDREYRLNDSIDFTNLRVTMKKLRTETRLKGRVIELPNRTGISQAEIRFQGVDEVVKTDSTGNFSVVLPVQPGTEMRIVVTRGNREIYNSLRTVDNNDFIDISAN